jgi:ankyrin repeat protein
MCFPLSKIKFIASFLILFFFSLFPKFAYPLEIHDAVIKGDLEKIKTLVKQNPSIIDCFEDTPIGGRTPLFLAVYWGHKDIVKFLISNGANVNSIDIYGHTSLHQTKSLDIAKLLIAAGADVNARDSSGETPLHQTKSLDIAKLLIAAGADVNARDFSGETPLHHACSREIAELLISNGADVKSQSSYNVTPLHTASQSGNLDVVRLLFSNGANINSRTKHNSTPLHYALRSSGIKVAEYLILNGANVNAMSNDGSTPLSIAVDFGVPISSLCGSYTELRKKTIALLIQYDARVKTIIEAIASDDTETTAAFLEQKPQSMNDFLGYGTPLHCAAFWGSCKVAAYLVKKGTHIDVDSDLGTPLHISSTHGDKKMTELLLSNGANVNSKDKYGRTPLYAAVVYGDEKAFIPVYDYRIGKYCALTRIGTIGSKDDFVEIVRLLIAAGADVNLQPENPTSDIKLKKGAYPLQIAVIKNWDEMVRLLLSAGAKSVINKKDYIWHYTPLHHAAEQGSKTIVELLLANGADVNIKNDLGKTALQISQEKGYLAIADLLRKHGAKE